jgi:predicted O-methyltransferase YrrM
MEHFYQGLGENWFTYSELYSKVVDKFPTNSHFVEVGVWKGMSAAYMAVEIINSGKNIKFDCVDNWEYIELQKDIPKDMYDGLYETFLNNIEPVKHIINPIRELSWDAARHYEDNSLDFIFIDAGHDYDSIKKDITAWYPKLKTDGIIAGHDYSWDGITKATNEYFKGKQFYHREACWVLRTSTSAELYDGNTHISTFE